MAITTLFENHGGLTMVITSGLTTFKKWLNHACHHCTEMVNNTVNDSFNKI